jgi:Protein of unknown function (DUF4232)
MSDMRDDLREALQRQADQVPPHRDVPRSLAGRARRRIAVNALGVGLALVVVAGGAFAGLRTLGSSPTVVLPAGPNSTASQQSGATVAACTSARLRAVGSFEGAAGSREGGVTLTNFSDATCTLTGTPAITLLNQNLKPITSDVTFSSGPPGWKVDGTGKPAGWPVVTLHPGDAALVRIRWSNWCPQGRPAPLWRVGTPGGGSVDVANGFDELPPPPCNGPGMPSTIEVGPFEPSTAQ